MAAQGNKVNVILGGQWGDEGKGKIVDLLSAKYDIVCRCQGGSNAGHTVVVNNQAYIFHLIPSGVIHSEVISIIGNGVVIHIPSLIDEIEQCEKQGLTDIRQRILISDRSHIVLDLHMQTDRIIEDFKGSDSIGTTKKGIGPTYSSKMTRTGLRICDLMGDFNVFSQKLEKVHNFYHKIYPMLSLNLEEELKKYKIYAEMIRSMVTDVTVYLHHALAENKKILAEGANGCLLDIDFGTYPYVTSSNCNTGGVCTGLGLPPSAIGEIGAVIKSYCTRVGGGPFPTELQDSLGAELQTIGAEFGATTGRKRRCGWLDLVNLRTSHLLNNLSYLVLTKIDVLDQFDEIKLGIWYENEAGQKIEYFPASLDSLANVKVHYVSFPGWKCSTIHCRKYQDLPKAARDYIEFIEKQVGVPVRYIGVGKDRDSIITKQLE